MKRNFGGLVAAWAAAFGISLGGAAVAADGYANTGAAATLVGHTDGHGHAEPDCCVADACNTFSDSCEDACCDEGAGRWLFEAELTFFRYHRADGIRVGDDAPADDVTDNPFQLAPRFTVGYMGADGFGVRARWWEYDMSTDAVEGSPSNLGVDTYNFDVEAFDRIQLNSVWDLEISAGVRYNSFNEYMNDLVGDTETRFVSFNGWGGLLGLEVRRCIGANSAVFARARGAILMDDKTLDNVGSGNVVLLDSTQGMTELALGLEANYDMGYGMYLYGRFAGEWQNWYNFSSNFDEGAADPETFWTGASDVGFGGVVLSVGVVR